jgi:hypothetical protein
MGPRCRSGVVIIATGLIGRHVLARLDAPWRARAAQCATTRVGEATAAGATSLPGAPWRIME